MDATTFLNYLKKKICPQKVEKNTLKSGSEKLKSTFFSHTAWAAQTAQTEEFKFQMYIELGIHPLEPKIKAAVANCNHFSLIAKNLALIF